MRACLLTTYMLCYVFLHVFNSYLLQEWEQRRDYNGKSYRRNGMYKMKRVSNNNYCKILADYTTCIRLAGRKKC